MRRFLYWFTNKASLSRVAVATIIGWVTVLIIYALITQVPAFVWLTVGSWTLIALGVIALGLVVGIAVILIGGGIYFKIAGED